MVPCVIPCVSRAQRQLFLPSPPPPPTFPSPPQDAFLASLGSLFLTTWIIVTFYGFPSLALAWARDLFPPTPSPAPSKPVVHPHDRTLDPTTDATTTTVPLPLPLPVSPDYPYPDDPDSDDGESDLTVPQLARLLDRGAAAGTVYLGQRVIRGPGRVTFIRDHQRIIGGVFLHTDGLVIAAHHVRLEGCRISHVPGRERAALVLRGRHCHLARVELIDNEGYGVHVTAGGVGSGPGTSLSSVPTRTSLASSAGGDRGDRDSGLDRHDDPHDVRDAGPRPSTSTSESEWFINGTMEDCVMLRHGRYAVLAEREAHLALTRCTISGGQEWGLVAVGHGTHVTCTEGNVEGNWGTGVSAWAGAHIHLVRTRVSRNHGPTGNGIHAHGSGSHVAMVGGKVTMNGGAGLVALEGGCVTVTQSQFVSFNKSAQVWVAGERSFASVNREGKGDDDEKEKEGLPGTLGIPGEENQPNESVVGLVGPCQMGSKHEPPVRVGAGGRFEGHHMLLAGPRGVLVDVTERGGTALLTDCKVVDLVSNDVAIVFARREFAHLPDAETPSERSPLSPTSPPRPARASTYHDIMTPPRSPARAAEGGSGSGRGAARRLEVGERTPGMGSGGGL